MMLLSRIWSKAEQHGKSFTAFDAMKLFAIVNMTADHIGAYFFPEVLWWRAIGRITFPVWFFLVGYSRSRDISKELWLYAFLMMAVHPFVHQPFLPTNALVTVIICRLMLNLCVDRGWLTNRLPELVVACYVMTLPTVMLFEYGAIAFLYTMLGRMVREKHEHITGVAVASYVLFILMQYEAYNFDMVQFVYVALGTAWVVNWLANCSHAVIWANWERSIFKTSIAVLSRNTLPYYFYHRVLFQVLAALLAGKLGYHFSW